MTPRRGTPGRLGSEIWLSATVVGVMGAAFCAGEWAVRRYVPHPFLRYQESLLEGRGPFFRIEGSGSSSALVQVPRHRHLVPWPPQRFPLKKRPGVERWIVLGESSARGLGRELEEVADPNLEIINMATSASSLEQVSHRLDEALHYSPDRIVLLFGHNLFMYHSGLIIDHPVLAWLRAWLRRSRLIDFIADRLPHPPTPSFPTRGRLLAYEALLKRLGSACRRAGCRPVFCTVPGNLLVSPGDDEGARFDPAFLEARFLYMTGRRQAAIQKCRALVASRPAAYWSFQLGD